MVYVAKSQISVRYANQDNCSPGKFGPLIEKYMTNFKLSYYNVTTDIINPGDTSEKRIIFSTRTAKAMTLLDSSYQKIMEGRLKDLTSTELFSLTEQSILVPENEDEFAAIQMENEAFLSDRKVLYHVLQPGANCQLGCHYCGQQHTKNFLDPSLYEKVINRIEGKILSGEFEYNTLAFTWYGGEPLMALRQMRDLTYLLKEVAHRHGMKYYADIITNGLSLKEKIFEELVSELGIRSFQITVDGTREHHDRRRITKSEEPTFDIIMDNIVKCVNSPLVQQYNVTIGVRINIDKSNHADVDEFLEYLHSRGILNKVIVQFAEIVDWGQNGASKESLTIQEFADTEIGWMLKLIELGFNMNSFIPERSNVACMVQEKNSEVFDAFGNIYPCYELPYTPIYENTEWYVGNIKNDKSTYEVNNSLRNWSEHIRKGDVSNCNTCKFYPVCGGGCPKSWLEGKPSCPSFKFNMEDRLVLQYLNKNTSIKELI
ncbi:uncharacterized protein SAMN05421827_12548 [Pedobacter terrae]|uniref:Radical SAM core domain-containing protein n=2 Tax=Pedobacter terrae TaxID=405671 RepID=A0A1G8CLQ6_9SPHI|nr:uncharacterized protein SAMN05421827_12548 [Pedobacter terrae]